MRVEEREWGGKVGGECGRERGGMYVYGESGRKERGERVGGE